MKAVFVVLAIVAAAQGAKWQSLNDMLGADIFPAERNTIASENTLAAFKSLLADRNVLQAAYSTYMEQQGKSALRGKDQAHLTIFQENLVKIVEHNLLYEAGQSSWYKGVNQFTDMTEDEINAQYTGYKVSFAEELEKSDIPKAKPRQFHTHAPNDIDWRGYGVVTSIKNQGGCGSCVPFAAAACLESSHALWHNGQIFDLSEQELIDCSKGNGNNGCAGGTFVPTFDYMRNVGLTTEGEYPYEERDNTPCRNGGKSHPARVSGWWPVEPHGNEDALKEAVSLYGPIAVAIHVNGDFQAYRGGIFEAPCQGGRNHAILAVGYGNEGGRDFWTAKNQWGNWGEGGFIRMRRNWGNICDIAGDAVLINA